MSLDLFQRETQERISSMPPESDPVPAIFDGFGRGVGLTAMQGLMRAGRSIDLLGSIGPIAKDAVTGGTVLQDRYFKEHETWDKAVDYFTPRRNEVGMAGQIVGNLISTVGMALVSPGLAVGEQLVGTSEDLVKKGVEPTKALTVGTASAAAFGAGIWMPILGQNLWQRMAVGAGFNLTQGVATRAAGQVVLEGTPAAEDYKAFDSTALTLDVLLGMAFGGWAHLSPESRAHGAKVWESLQKWAQQLPPSDVAAIATLRQAQHLNVDSAPGIPATERDVEAHVERLRTAIEQLERGQPVDVSDLPEPNFTPEPKRMAEMVRRATELMKEGERARKIEDLPASPALDIRPAASLSPEHRAMESRFAAQLNGDVEGSIKAYEKLPGTENGKILSTDLARDLSPDYAGSKDARSLNAQAVHEPASALIKELYARKLAAPSANGLNMVTFTAGGTGVGKTTGIERTPVTHEITDASDIVYDTNMNNYPSAKEKVDMALEKGKQVNIIYVGREPVESMVNGVIPRAMRQGRTVPLTEHARTHRSSADAIGRLLQDYDGNDKVQFIFIDNSRGKSQSEVATPALLKAYSFDNLEQRLKEALDAEYQAGRVSAVIYQGIAGHVPGGEGALPGRGVQLRAQQERGGQPAGAAAAGGAAARGEVAPAPDEVAAAAPPQPGQKFLVFRLGRTETLAHRNAANADALARYLMGVEDEMGPVSSKADKVFAYEVSTEKPFGAYEGLTGGRPGKEAAVGRVARGDEVSYSFPEGGYSARLVAKKTLQELWGELEAAGHKNFDEAGSRAGAQVLRTAFGVTPTEGPAATPGVTESPPPRGSAAVETAGLTAPRGIEADMAAQAQWLTQRATERGFTGIDDMAAKDIGGFIKLTEEWRGAHPAQPDIVTTEANRIVEAAPDQPLRIGTNQDGSPIHTTAREYLEQARAVARSTREDASLFQVAAECMLGQGA